MEVEHTNLDVRPQCFLRDLERLLKFSGRVISRFERYDLGIYPRPFEIQLAKQLRNGGQMREASWDYRLSTFSQVPLPYTRAESKLGWPCCTMTSTRC